MTDVLGLLIAGVRERIPNGDPAIMVLDKLSRSNFRMSIPFYLRTKEEILKVKDD
ncbi:MAG: hypothetical protein QCI82_01560 [Candidatus Thermoplasmatota archaeon]|nr:hypothetical protein [Candidatus Thermoplasmatota archaeon]